MRLRRIGRFVINLDGDPTKPVTSMTFSGEDEDAEALRRFLATLPEWWPPERSDRPTPHAPPTDPPRRG